MISEFSTMLPNLGSALTFAQELGAGGVASAIENAMCSGNAPLVLDAIDCALNSFPGTQESVYLQQLCRTDEKFVGYSSALFHREALAPVLRLHARTIDDALQGFKCREKAGPPRVAQPCPPTEADATTFLIQTGLHGLIVGIHTAIFGSYTVSKTFDAMASILSHMLRDSLYRREGDDLLSTLKHLEWDADAVNGQFARDLQVRLLSKYEAFIDKALGLTEQGSARAIPYASEKLNFPNGLNKNLYIPMEIFCQGLSTRARHALDSRGFYPQFVADLCRMTRQDMLKIARLGGHTLTEIENALAQLGLSLGMQFEGFSQVQAGAMIMLEKSRVPQILPASHPAYLSIDEFRSNLSPRAADALLSWPSYPRYVGQLCKTSRKDAFKMPRVRRSALLEIEDALKRLHLGFGMELEGFSVADAMLIDR